MTYHNLENPKAFTMSQFLPLFAFTLVCQQAKFERNNLVIENALSQRKRIIENYPEESDIDTQSSERGNITVNIFELDT